MGEFRKYRPYYACNALRFNGTIYSFESRSDKENAITRVPNFKDIIGVEYKWLKNLNSSYINYNDQRGTQSTISGIPNQSIYNAVAITNNYQSFISLIPFATSDLLSDYSVDDYEINAKGRTDFTSAKFVAEDVNKILYSMSVFNDNQDEYVLNDSLIWDPEKAYYALVDGNYVPVSEQPVDWSETYNTYYILELAEDIEVSCIKFRVCLASDTETSNDYNLSTKREHSSCVQLYALLCSYFLDEPVTIHPGDSYLLSLSFESSQF